MSITRSLNYNYLPKKNNFTFPLFKFLRAEHAKNMLETGELYIPNIASFRKYDNQKNDSKINDIDEGSFHLSLNGDFKGKAKNLPEGLELPIHPDTNLNIKNFTWNRHITLPDILIYCCAGQLLSDSTLWALKEGKTSCVMILDTNKFRQSIEEKCQNHQISDFSSCIYKDDRTYKGKLDEKLDKNNLLHYYWYKPTEYQEQREVRLCMSHNKKNEDLTPIKVNIPEISSNLIEVNIGGIDINVLSGKKEGKIIHTVYKKDGGKPSTFTIKKPFGVYSPVIVNSTLGFYDWTQGKTYDSPTLSDCEIGFCHGVFCLNPIHNIEKIVLTSSC